MKVDFQRVLIPLFTFVYRKRLAVFDQDSKFYDTSVKVVKVLGWRTARVDQIGRGRLTTTFCFWWFN